MGKAQPYRVLLLFWMLNMFSVSLRQKPEKQGVAIQLNNKVIPM